MGENLALNLLLSPVYALKEWQEGGGVGTGEFEGVATFKAIEVIFSNLLNVIVVLLGFVLFVMLLIAGLNYLTSEGDPEKVKKAGATLTWALTGFILLFLSWFIIRIISSFTGINLMEFEIPGTGTT